MNDISCVIVACSKSSYHTEITKQAIISSGVDCIIIETFSKINLYKEAKKTLFWHKEFNYNACLNLGIMHTDTEYIALCNNDIVFTKDWTGITDTMIKENVVSASPYSMYNQCRNGYTNDGTVHFGYQAGHEMCGWCIVIHNSIFKLIGKLDESQKFWCSDDAYADQLKAYGLKHMLDCGHVVNHIGGGSRTLNTLNRAKYVDFTINEYNRYQYAKTIK